MAVKTPICELLNIEAPIFLAGMGGVAYADVCAAVSEAGGYGTLGMAAEDPESIRREMRLVRKKTDKPFGVDLLAALPEQMMAALEVVIEEGASSFIAGLGVPGPVVERCHEAGLLVMSLCGKVSHAVAAEQAGCDVVIAQGTEAGGHTGRVAGMALIPQVVDAVDIPVLGAGSIVDGRGLAACLAFGAQGAWMGTRFIASHEARAAHDYKKAIGRTASDETTITRCYSGKPMRVIANPYVEARERDPGSILRFPDQMYASVQEGVMRALGGGSDEVEPTRDAMPCGQGAGAIDDILSCREIVDRTLAEAEAVITSLQPLVAGP